MNRKDILAREIEIRQWIAEHRSKAFICRQLHCKPTTLNSYLSKLGIEYKGNQGSKGRRSTQLKPAAAYLHNGSNIHSHHLKLKLIRDGIKAAECESCKLNHWFKQQIPLELHHINGDRFDNRLENLQILCPNCHALTDNHAGKAIRKVNPNPDLRVSKFESDNDDFVSYPIGILVFDSSESYLQWQSQNQSIKQIIDQEFTQLPEIENKCCHYCGNQITSNSKNIYCSRKCYRQASRKVKHPSKEELQKLIWLKPTTHLAKDFGVSDKAIEKWCKAYGINKPPRGYWTKQKITNKNKLKTD